MNLIHSSVLRRGLAAGVLTCAVATCAPVPPAPVRPRLVVLIVVDQMRADYLTRFATHYSAGLARLASEGTVYTQAHHAHAYTVTASGHATLATGLSPSRNGIVGNIWWERSAGRRVGTVEDPSTRRVDEPDLPGASPFRLRTDGVADWLRAASPASSVWSVAIKDRSAILPAGRQPDGAFWYDSQRGRFVTSDYYVERTPAWVDAFNANGPLEDYRGGWSLLHDPATYTNSREDRFESEGTDATFPHRFSSAAAYYQELIESPFGDQLTLEFARRLLREEQLGSDDAPDLLIVGLSSADLVGHRYGPFSVEVEDYYRRLDLLLAEFFDALDAQVGDNAWLVAFSSDHGVVALPEQSQRDGRDARRIPWGETSASVETVFTQTLEEIGIAHDSIRLSYANGWVLDADTSVSAEQLVELRSRMALALRHAPRVEDVFTSDELAAAQSSGRPYEDLFRASFDAQRSADLMLRYREYDLPNAGLSGTSHGSAYRYDTHVPLIFLGAHAAAQTIDRPARTMDVAPTLATCLGVAFPATLDGQPLAEVCR